ncbi:hypothetical protein BC937DRAFT_92209 [Endogone sp. FLAS-F59071]|nr:hypothetical protein BC937DRAFT_92209 [Endogone sp. FLAS-F59071]|eukprot:RUS23119.1 hypothetical protein BC937DRAFT_92209 [Endogone sp. FLAS-F59071]
MHLLHHPAHPSLYDWSRHYPDFFPSRQGDADGNKETSGSADVAMSDTARPSKKVEFADIGCGYGGLLIALAPLFPQTLMLGMEIRVKVEAYVDERIKALRIQEPGKYQNVSIIRMNAMKFLPNFFEKAQVSRCRADLTWISTRRVLDRCIAIANSILWLWGSVPSSLRYFFCFLIRISRRRSTRPALSVRPSLPSTPTFSASVVSSTPSPMSRIYTIGWSSTSTSILYLRG